MLGGFARFQLGIIQKNRYLNNLKKPELDFVVMLCRNKDYMVNVHRCYIEHLLRDTDMSSSKVDFKYVLNQMLIAYYPCGREFRYERTQF